MLVEKSVGVRYLKRELEDVRMLRFVNWSVEIG